MTRPESDRYEFHLNRHKDEYPQDMQEIGEAFGLFNEDGTLKSFDEILSEEIDKFIEGE